MCGEEKRRKEGKEYTLRERGGRKYEERNIMCQ